ncbi:MAG: DNA gyrase inhibitor YacG [Sphingomonadales bacterium]|nr:DNA gyrase inhibitor YacG [Sphingomonadales bacterium]
MTANAKSCPICGKPRHPEHAPFCSSRCKDRDLVRWLDDGYALPGPPAIDEEADKASLAPLPSAPGFAIGALPTARRSRNGLSPQRCPGSSVGRAHD